MGLQKILSLDHEYKNDKKKASITDYKKIDKQSNNNKDLIKRIEAIEKILGLE